MTKLSLNDTEYVELLLTLRESGSSWDDIASFINEEFDCTYSSDKYRKDYYKIDFNYEEAPDAYLDVEDAFAEAELNLKIKQQQARDTLTSANALIRRAGREDTIRELGLEVAKLMNSKKQLAPIKPIKSKQSDNVGILCISDWHYGLAIDNFYNKYDIDIAKRRIAQLRDKTISIIEKEQLKELVILNLGDLISGRIHLPLRINSQIDAITQIEEVSELLCEFINDLLSYVNIRYTSVIDNHSRVEPNKKESLQLESLCRITDWYMEKRLEDAIKQNRLTIEKNEYGPDMTTFKIYNHKIIGVHGDKDKQKTIISKLNNFTQGHQDLILSAHMHHFSADESNETELYCNGSLMGTDDYANDLRLNSKPSQLLIVADAENVSKVIYKIKLD